MKCFKRVFALCLCLVMLAGLCACGDKKKEEDKTETDSTQKIEYTETWVVEPSIEAERIFSLPLTRFNSKTNHYDVTFGDCYVVEKDGKLRLTGFCISEERTARSNITAQLFPGFAAVEQYGVIGKQGSWTDVYGFAATLYRTLVGNPPQEASERVNEDNLTIPAKIMHELPQATLEMLANALQILPEDRTETF